MSSSCRRCQTPLPLDFARLLLMAMRDGILYESFPWSCMNLSLGLSCRGSAHVSIATVPLLSYFFNLGLVDQCHRFHVDYLSPSLTHSLTPSLPPSLPSSLFRLKEQIKDIIIISHSLARSVCVCVCALARTDTQARVLFCACCFVCLCLCLCLRVLFSVFELFFIHSCE